MVMKPKLYLETTIVSYLTARPGRDLVRAAHQQVIRDWWDTRSRFDLFISQFVLDEASEGDPDAAERRLLALGEATLLDLTSDAKLIADDILRLGGMPAKAYVDAMHVGVATAHGLDYLLTWNCAHIARAAMRGRIEEICRNAGFEPPIICTPIEFMED